MSAWHQLPEANRSVWISSPAALADCPAGSRATGSRVRRRGLSAELTRRWHGSCRQRFAFRPARVLRAAASARRCSLPPSRERRRSRCPPIPATVDRGPTAEPSDQQGDQCLAPITKAWTRGNARSAWYARFGRNGECGIEKRSEQSDQCLAPNTQHEHQRIPPGTSTVRAVLRLPTVDAIAPQQRTIPEAKKPTGRFGFRRQRLWQTVQPVRGLPDRGLVDGVCRPT